MLYVLYLYYLKTRISLTWNFLWNYCNQIYYYRILMYIIYYCLNSITKNISLHLYLLLLLYF